MILIMIIIYLDPIQRKILILASQSADSTESMYLPA